jgi:hypothetical protein
VVSRERWRGEEMNVRISTALFGDAVLGMPSRLEHRRQQGWVQALRQVRANPGSAAAVAAADHVRNRHPHIRSRASCKWELSRNVFGSAHLAGVEAIKDFFIKID